MRVTWPRWIAASSTLVAILAMLSSAAHARDGAGRPRTDPRRAERAGQGPSVLHGSGADGGTVFDGESFWWIGGISGSDTGATSAVPNAGVLTQLDVVPYPPDGGCFDCWTSDLLANGYWGQVGFSSCNFGESTMYDLTAFYQVWDTNSNPAAILVDGETTVVTPGLHTYAMVNTSGTTWEYLVDGSPLGRYDMGAGSATSYAAVATVCEEGDGITAPFVPPAISVPVAMSVVDPSTSDWSGATAGWLYNTSGLSGVAGDIADPQLAEDAMIIGGSGPTPMPGSPCGAAPRAARPSMAASLPTRRRSCSSPCRSRMPPSRGRSH